MYNRSEGFFKGFQDIQLHYQKWEPQAPSKAVLVLTHGHGEHSDCYDRVIEALDGLNLTIFAWDWRGHGKSEGQRGYARHFNDYVLDYESFLRFIFENKNYAELPKLALGHSMGGLIQLKGILSNPQFNFKAQVLSAPFLGVAVKVPVVKEWGARALNILLPKLTLWNEVRNEALSRDQEILKEYEQDALRQDRISSGVYLGSLETMDFIFARAGKLETPSLFQIPDQDPVASSEKTREFFQLLSAGKNKDRFILKVYLNRKHEIYNDLQRENLIRFTPILGRENQLI